MYGILARIFVFSCILCGNKNTRVNAPAKNTREKQPDANRFRTIKRNDKCSARSIHTVRRTLSLSYINKVVLNSWFESGLHNGTNINIPCMLLSWLENSGTVFLTKTVHYILFDGKIEMTRVWKQQGVTYAYRPVSWNTQWDNDVTWSFRRKLFFLAFSIICSTTIRMKNGNHTCTNNYVILMTLIVLIACT